MIAIVLIVVTTSFPVITTEQAKATFTPEVREIIKEGWIAAGVLEEFERSSYFLYHNEYHDQQEIMKSRLSTLTSCPPIEDVYRFPPSKFARDRWNEGYQYTRYLQHMLDIGLNTPQEKEALEDNLAYTKSMLEFWDLVDYLNSGYTRAYGRRGALKRIKEIIGEVQYREGEWPNPLPPSGYFQPWEPPPYPQYG